MKNRYITIAIITLISILLIDGYAYEVPLKQQINNSCVTTSLSMVMETWNESHNQTFWDICAKRKPNSFTYLSDIELCIWSLGYHFSNIDSSYVWDLKAKDLVVYHVLGYDNKTDLHVSVIESINMTNKSVILANPWGRYDSYTFKEFERIYIGKALRIKSFNKGNRDELFVMDIDETITRQQVDNIDNECIRLYKETFERKSNIINPNPYNEKEEHSKKMQGIIKKYLKKYKVTYYDCR